MGNQAPQRHSASPGEIRRTRLLEGHIAKALDKALSKIDTAQGRHVKNVVWPVIEAYNDAERHSMQINPYSTWLADEAPCLHPCSRLCTTQVAEDAGHRCDKGFDQLVNDRAPIRVVPTEGVCLSPETPTPQPCEMDILNTVLEMYLIWLGDPHEITRHTVQTYAVVRTADHYQYIRLTSRSKFAMANDVKAKRLLEKLLVKFIPAQRQRTITDNKTQIQQFKLNWRKFWFTALGASTIAILSASLPLVGATEFESEDRVDRFARKWAELAERNVDLVAQQRSVIDAITEFQEQTLTDHAGSIPHFTPRAVVTPQPVVGPRLTEAEVGDIIANAEVSKGGEFHQVYIYADKVFRVQRPGHQPVPAPVLYGKTSMELASDHGFGPKILSAGSLYDGSPYEWIERMYPITTKDMGNDLFLRSIREQTVTMLKAGYLNSDVHEGNVMKRMVPASGIAQLRTRAGQEAAAQAGGSSLVSEFVFLDNDQGFMILFDPKVPGFKIHPDGWQGAEGKEEEIELWRLRWGNELVDNFVYDLEDIIWSKGLQRQIPTSRRRGPLAWQDPDTNIQEERTPVPPSHWDPETTLDRQVKAFAERQAEDPDFLEFKAGREARLPGPVSDVHVHRHSEPAGGGWWPEWPGRVMANIHSAFAESPKLAMLSARDLTGWVKSNEHLVQAAAAMAAEKETDSY